MFFTVEKVRFVDTDMMGVVHHSNYFKWFETARTSYLKAAGVSLWDLMDDDYSFPISDVRCTYKVSAKYDDDLKIYTKLLEITKAKMIFSYQIVRTSDDILLAEGYTCNIFTKVTGKVTRLPDKYYLKIVNFAKQEKEV